ncbi:MAG TPA: MBL fold metallo-hydrolase [Mobilitalea sp.]|nr:MBL fold metallo-hydrolase [Mobilitalea sp.]
MRDWFTIEMMDQNTYAISEKQHWEETHCYLLIGKLRALLIDTGLGVSNVHNVIKELTDLPVTAIPTHIHWDHIGGLKHFHDVAIHEAEMEWLVHFPLPLQIVKQNLLREPCEFPQDFNIDNYQVFHGKPSLILHDNDTIDLGGRIIQVIHTPGHSPGHMCLYENDKGYLFSGDLIYEGTLDAFYPSTDPYEFMLSVGKVKEFPINKVFPAHHKLNISVELIDQIYQSFASLQEDGKLIQGNGIYRFKNYNIHI